MVPRQLPSPRGVRRARFADGVKGAVVGGPGRFRRQGREPFDLFHRALGLVLQEGLALHARLAQLLHRLVVRPPLGGLAGGFVGVRAVVVRLELLLQQPAHLLVLDAKRQPPAPVLLELAGLLSRHGLRHDILVLVLVVALLVASTSDQVNVAALAAAVQVGQGLARRRSLLGLGLVHGPGGAGYWQGVAAAKVEPKQLPRAWLTKPALALPRQKYEFICPQIQGGRHWTRTRLSVAGPACC